MAPRTVLVIDDNPAVTRFVESILRPLGYKLETANDGIEALQRIVHGPIDLILLDFVMPRMNGYLFCKTLDEKGLAKDVPIVLMSATEERVYERMKEHTRVIDFLPKPVTASALRHVIERHMCPREPMPSGAVASDPVQQDEFGFDLSSSEDAIVTPAELLANLRDRVQNAVAEGLTSRLDQIVQSQSREQTLGIIAEMVASIVDDKLLNQLIDLVRGTEK